MLKVEHISSGYEKKQVLYDVSFEIEKGDIVTLVGSNGSGKSTLLKSIYGLLPLMNFGKLFFNCEDIAGFQPHKIIEKGLLYVPQKNNVFPELSVLENLEVAGINLTKDELRSNMHKTLEIFKPLKLLINRMPTSLSGGEKQLLALSMANLYEPKMILFDEPFNGLSPKSIRLLQDYILELNNINGTTFLFAEHRIFESIKIANKIISLKLGKVFSQQKVLSDFNYKELIPIFI